MMEYCARESTICEGELCVDELTTSEIVKDIRKELAETVGVLSQIKTSIDGEMPADRKADEPKCLHDDIKLIERMAIDCMGLAHTIQAKLFRM